MELKEKVSGIFERREDTILRVMNKKAQNYRRMLNTPEVNLGMRSFEAELENLLGVLDEIHQHEPALEQLAHLISNIQHYFDICGLWEILLDYCLTLVARYVMAGKAFPIHLINTIANIYEALGDYDMAMSFHEIVVPSLENDPHSASALATHYNNLGIVYRKKGDLDQAQLYLERSIELERQRHNKTGEALSLMNLSEVYYGRWEMDQALQLALQAIDLIEQTDNVHLQAQLSATLAMTMVANLQFDEAAPIYELAIQHLTQIGDEIYLAEVQFNYALLCRILKQYDLGRHLTEACLPVFEQAGMKNEAQKATDLLQKYQELD